MRTAKLTFWLKLNFLLIFFIPSMVFASQANVHNNRPQTTQANDQPSQSYVFLILGYGVPKDIFHDENYRIYLGTAFNKIFDVVQEKNVDVSVVFCGGYTDLFEPYFRTEAGEMKKYFKYLLERPFLKDYSKKIHFFEEDESLSTLENILFAQKIIQEKNLNIEKVFIFGEKTRKTRIKKVAEEIFKMPTKIFTIDFDMSEQRYDSSFIRSKEMTELKQSLWALKNPENLKKYHEFFVEKFELLRKASPENRKSVLQQFWKKLQDLDKT